MTVVDDGVKTKTCNICFNDKSIEDFYSNQRSADGYSYTCKECEKKRTKTAYYGKKTGITAVTRAERFEAGLIEVKDLTREELVNGFIYQDDGTKYDVASFSKRSKQKFENEIGRRLNAFIREKSFRAIEIIFEIADSELVEPADRLKASTWIAERMIGKTPDVIQMEVSTAPHESIFETLVGGNRDDHRKAIGQAIDAEIVEVETVEQNGTESEGLGESSNVDSEFDDGESTGSGSNVQSVSNGNDATGASDDNGNRSTTETGSGDVEPGSCEKSLRNVDGSDNENGISAESEADKIVEKKESIQDLRKRISNEKRRRYAARAAGATSLASVPWLIDWRVTERGVVACLVPPVEQTPAKLAIINVNEKATDDINFVRTQMANKLAVKSERLSSLAKKIGNQHG